MFFKVNRQFNGRQKIGADRRGMGQDTSLGISGKDNWGEWKGKSADCQ